ncbi:MAG: hypothetical protein KatS3mg129_0708 [Leptospiraceae bacterium]|nr:MAG: hypothetical protein KatS3mg129_0708 [Leptospiraceae bacterium]
MSDSFRIENDIWKMINLRIDGKIYLSSGNIKIKESNTRLKNLDLSLKIENSLYEFEKPSLWSGEIYGKAKEIYFEELWGPLRTFSLPDEQRILKNLDFYVQLNKGNFSIRKFNVKSVLFDISLNANGSFSNSIETIENSTINGKVCLKPNDKLEELNPFIYNIYLGAGGSLGGELCFTLKGTFSNLNFEPQT